MISEKNFFNPIGTAYINVRFACPYCQAEINSGYLDVHAPNFAAKESKDSYIDEDHESTCDECGENYWMTMYVGNDDAYIEMENPDEIFAISCIGNDEQQVPARWPSQASMMGKIASLQDRKMKTPT